MFFKSSFHLLILIPFISAFEPIEQEVKKVIDDYKDISKYIPSADVYQNLGHLTLRATSDLDSNFTWASVKFDNENKSHAHIQYKGFEGKLYNGEIDIKFLENSTNFQYKWTSPERRNLPARIVIPLYMDGEYFIGVVLFPETKTEVLQIIARAELEFDAKHLNDLLFDRVSNKRKAYDLIDPMINQLGYMKPDFSGFYAPPPIQLAKNELVRAKTDQLIGTFNLLQTSDGILDHDHIVAFLDRGDLKILRYSGKGLVDTIISYSVKSMGLPVLIPVKKRIDNLRSYPIQIDEVYSSNSTLITYEYSYNCEKLRVYVRKGHTISDYMNGISSSAKSKLANLLNKLSPIKIG